MNSRTQAGLEYLMTYGWALVLIAAAIGILVFIVGSPASDITFSSSDPTKILIKAGAVTGTIAEVQLHNVTGGDISITRIVGDLYSDCTIDGASPLAPDGESSPISVGAGNQMTLECTTPADGLGRAIIDYSDFAGLQRTVIITASGAEAGPYCGDGECTGNESNQYSPEYCPEDCIVP